MSIHLNSMNHTVIPIREAEVKIVDWFLGRDQKAIPKLDPELNASVEKEIAKSIVERHKLEKKVVHYYPLIADMLIPYRGENEKSQTSRQR